MEDVAEQVEEAAPASFIQQDMPDMANMEIPDELPSEEEIIAQLEKAEAEAKVACEEA